MNNDDKLRGAIRAFEDSRQALKQANEARDKAVNQLGDAAKELVRIMKCQGLTRVLDLARGGRVYELRDEQVLDAPFQGHILA
jgi:hypothetical protein